MTPEKIIAAVEMYESQLIEKGMPKIRMDPKRTFGSLCTDELLAHAHYLTDGTREYARDPSRQGKANRHLTAIQMCLSFANWYTLEELMNHNRPEQKDVGREQGALIRRPTLLNCPFCGRKIDDFSYQMHVESCRQGRPVPPLIML